MKAFLAASRRLVQAPGPGVWVGAIRAAFDAVAEPVADGVERHPPHWLVALWEPPEAGELLLPRWPAVAAIASPDSQAALLQLVSHLPAGAPLWLSLQEPDWALIGRIVLLSDRNLHPVQRRELQRFVDGREAADRERILREYSDLDAGFELLKRRLLPPQAPD
ncbi:hypothetical protein [Caldimonas tepidiphila]|uniref:hypothetical protein n=1 Tax=Caldimonas tepidiphila TaxID=2315841 RepID=UPI0013007898|nr:hypothetical protein [Caldimonas tepidiphila]